MDPFLGEIRPAAFNFAPQNWALCQGQILAISQNTALFSLLGTTYGGNGTSTFALPNLQGNVAIGEGQGPGLPTYVLGETGGESAVTLLISNLPSHNHLVGDNNTASTDPSPVTHYPAKPLKSIYGTSSTGTMDPSAVIPDGGGIPHNNMQPYLSINYIIALSGVFPQRS